MCVNVCLSVGVWSAAFLLLTTTSSKIDTVISLCSHMTPASFLKNRLVHSYSTHKF